MSFAPVTESVRSYRQPAAVPESPEFDHPSSVLYFSVDDIQAVFTSLSGRGVRFEGPPHLIAKMDDHDLWMAFFADPDGHTLAVMQEAPKGYAPPPP